MKNMKVKKLLSAFAVIAISLAIISCSKDGKKVPDVNFTVKLEMPISVESPSLTSATAVFINISNGHKYSVSNFVESATKANGKTYSGTIILPEGSYNITVNGKIKYILSGTTVSGDVQTSREGVTVSEKEPNIDVVLATYNSKSGFVIEEIFFTGTLTPAGKQYSGDQYFKITNNSSAILYADGIAIIESSFLTVSKYDYKPDLMKEAMTTDAVYVIPGKGNEVPVEPGKSIIIALQAINHKNANSNSFDLSNADFEFYDESSNPKFTDTDNPKVKNLDKWYCYTATYFGLHNRGFKAYAIAKMDVSKETFLSDYYYEASYDMILPAGTFTMKSKGYKVPNAWIIDAVNLSIESMYEWIVTSPSLDAGWTYCGKVNSDKTRYGKAVRRKVEKVENGRNIFKDTNNSKVDFDAEVVPSLMK